MTVGAQVNTAPAHAWLQTSAGINPDTARGKLAAFMARWSFKLAHQMAEPEQSMRLLASDAHAGQDTAPVPARLQWQVAVQSKGNDGTALVRSLGAVNGADVDLFASVSRFWVGNDANSRFMTTAAARLARDEAFVLGAPYRAQGHTRRLQLEGGLGWLVRDDVVAGATYRIKSPATERPLMPEPTADEAWDVYVAWMPWWGGAVTLAWVNMASEPSQARTGGVFLSGQIAY
jgi:hypothetical protein